MKKKVLTAILTLCAVAAMTACGGNAGTTEVKETTETAESSEAEAQAEKEAEAQEREEAEEQARLAKASEHYESGRKSLYGLDGAQIDLEDAYTNFTKAQELGNTDANFYLGALADWYGYPEQDFEQAKVYYEQCEDNPYAQISLEFLYYNWQVDWSGENWEDIPKIFQSVVDQGIVEGYLGLAAIARDEGDYETASEYYQKVVEEGTEQLYIVCAMKEIGEMYQYGYGVEPDGAKAIEWYTKAADLGDSDAMLYIAQIYDWGDGIEQDYSAAVEWYTKAADLGNSDAMCCLGDMYHNGLGVAQDFDAAMEWYQKAADAGNALAMCNIAQWYRFGDGNVTMDANAAIEWYQKAADFGRMYALGDIGDMYRNGEGVEQSNDVAMEWYVKSLLADPNVFIFEDMMDITHGEDALMEKFAEAGDTKIMIAIGDMYCNSYGSGRVIQELPDYDAAMKWYQKAVDLGSSDAMVSIGDMLADWLYPEQDEAAAMEWYQKAVDLGNEEAQVRLEDLQEQSN